ncbi:MAG: hypothetical protein ABSG25_12865 [Bryobacteraceae bacterium]
MDYKLEVAKLIIKQGNCSFPVGVPCFECDFKSYICAKGDRDNRMENAIKIVNKFKKLELLNEI